MMKFLIWAVIAYAIVKWVQRVRIVHLKTDAALDSAKTEGAARDAAQYVARDAELMLQCAHCGVHIPESEALVNGVGTPFCSEEHRLLHRSD